MNLPAYRKTLAAVVTGLIGWATAVVASAPSRITAGEWIALATVLAVALGVWVTPNETSGQFTPEQVQSLLDDSYARGRSKKAKFKLEGGYGAVEVLLVVVLILLILWIAGAFPR